MRKTLVAGALAVVMAAGCGSDSTPQPEAPTDTTPRQTSGIAPVDNARDVVGDLNDRTSQLEGP